MRPGNRGVCQTVVGRPRYDAYYSSPTLSKSIDIINEFVLTAGEWMTSSKVPSVRRNGTGRPMAVCRNGLRGSNTVSTTYDHTEAPVTFLEFFDKIFG